MVFVLFSNCDIFGYFFFFLHFRCDFCCSYVCLCSVFVCNEFHKPCDVFDFLKFFIFFFGVALENLPYTFCILRVFAQMGHFLNSLCLYVFFYSTSGQTLYRKLLFFHVCRCKCTKIPMSVSFMGCDFQNMSYFVAPKNHKNKHQKIKKRATKHITLKQP